MENAPALVVIEQFPRHRPHDADSGITTLRDAVVRSQFLSLPQQRDPLRCEQRNQERLNLVPF